MADRVTSNDLELLADLGVETEPSQTSGLSAREQRIIAGFEEIERFVEEHGRSPEHGETRDIFERLYAVRLDRMRDSAECREVLRDRDSRGLLRSAPETECRIREDSSDAALLADLGVDLSSAEDVTRLVHVRSRDEIRAAEEIAQRNPCPDFEQFRPIFEVVQNELQTGARRTSKYQDNAEVKKGDLFTRWSESDRRRLGRSLRQRPRPPGSEVAGRLR